MTTILPDGSAFSTSEIMSKDEALKLPLKERPINYRISSEMYHAVFQSIGEASMQWNPRPGDQIFDSEGASRVAVDLCFKIAEEVEKMLRWRTTSETPNPYQRIRIMWSYDNIAAGRKDLSDSIQNYTDDTGFARGDGYTAIAWQPLSDFPAYLIPV